MHRRSHRLRIPPSVLLGSLTVLVLLSPRPVAGQDTPAETDTEERAPAFTHLHHVAVTFRGTPETRGLLPTAVAEADIALRHAELAAGGDGSLEGIQRHTRHVLHALEPSAVEDGGPGLGYGAIHAAERAAHYIGLARASDGSTAAMETHGEHIETAARNAVVTGTAAADLAREILETEDAETAAELLDELVERVGAMVRGIDADGDGSIGWQEGEGGLAQATRHLELLRRAEGLIGG